MRYFADISFDGAQYHGWQIQPGDVSVQEVVQNALATLCRCPVAVTGAGRTDAGVNARRMPAHFDLPDNIKPDSRFLLALNSLVGRAIAVNGIWPVGDTAHARFDARSRTYRYFVHTRKDPFATHSWPTPPGFDFEAMNEAAKILVGCHDFTSFAKLHSDAKTNICTVWHAQWKQQDATHWYFEITADRFLRNMVRAVVGTLADIGRHKMPPENIARILAMRDRCAAGTSMPANALFLWDVTYDYITFADATLPPVLS